jgi:hypothetical protein
MRAREFTIQVPITINIPAEEPEAIVAQPVAEPECGCGGEPEQHMEPVSDQTDSMVPPLQQQIELLKRAAGVKSVYDDNDRPQNIDARAAIMNAFSQNPTG